MKKILITKYANFPEPLKIFKYKINDFIKIKREIFTASVEYNISIINKNQKRDFILEDKLILNDNGWFISSRKIKFVLGVKND
ncbi:MAG: hypothetical protein KatS3mg068_0529 [Candidatus Sericytochromatia bacterium]|nr:MAG: hypothetical protein KatS3mg068_0529 [Candidatus Sericytochromatia bacterium]